MAPFAGGPSLWSESRKMFRLLLRPTLVEFMECQLWCAWILVWLSSRRACTYRIIMNYHIFMHAAYWYRQTIYRSWCMLMQKTSGICLGVPCHALPAFWGHSRVNSYQHWQSKIGQTEPVQCAKRSTKVCCSRWLLQMLHAFADRKGRC